MFYLSQFDNETEVFHHYIDHVTTDHVTSLLSTYEPTHEKRYLKVVRFVVRCRHSVLVRVVAFCLRFPLYLISQELWPFVSGFLCTSYLRVVALCLRFPLYMYLISQSCGPMSQASSKHRIRRIIHDVSGFIFRNDRN